MINTRPITNAAFASRGVPAVFHRGALALNVTVIVGGSPQKVTENGDVITVGDERELWVRQNELVSASVNLKPESGDTFTQTLVTGSHVWEVLPRSNERQSHRSDDDGYTLHINTRLKQIE